MNKNSGNKKLKVEDEWEGYDYIANLTYKIENVVGTVVTDIIKPVDLNLIAAHDESVQYNPERFPGLVMRIEKPRGTALIFSTGKMVITGLRAASEANKVVQKIIKNIKKVGIEMKNPVITVQNIVASGDLHTNIDLNMATVVMDDAMYEPEVFPGLIYRMQDPKTVFLVFSTGRIVCTGAKTKQTVREAVLKLNKYVREIGIAKKNLEPYDYGEFDFL